MKMTLLFSLTCVTTCAFAQQSFFGVDAGVNVANLRSVSSITGSSPINIIAYEDNAIKPSFGVFYQRGFSKSIAVRINAQYMGLGFKHNNVQESDIGINYFTVPITLHYYVTNSFSLTTGSYISFVVDGTKVNGQSITDIYHKNDFGFRFGAEQTIYKNFSVGMNYIIGMKNIILRDKIQYPSGDVATYKDTNRALQFSLIYKFRKSN